MGFFSKLFGKSSTKQQEEERKSFEEILDFYIIYKGYSDSDEEADKYSDLEDELWVYDCIGASGAMSSESAKKLNIPLPSYPDYPLIGVFELGSIEGYQKGNPKPLIISSNKEEVKQFIEEYERTHS